MNACMGIFPFNQLNINAFLGNAKKNKHDKNPKHETYQKTIYKSPKRTFSLIQQLILVKHQIEEKQFILKELY